MHIVHIHSNEEQDREKGKIRRNHDLCILCTSIVMKSKIERRARTEEEIDSDEKWEYEGENNRYI